jgi:hypothetical protein
MLGDVEEKPESDRLLSIVEEFSDGNVELVIIAINEEEKAIESVIDGG